MDGERSLLEEQREWAFLEVVRKSRYKDRKWRGESLEGEVHAEGSVEGSVANLVRLGARLAVRLEWRRRL